MLLVKLQSKTQLLMLNPEIKRQAAKFGNKIGKDGKSPTLGKKVRGNQTQCAF